MKKVHKIDIIPALYVERVDEKEHIKCLIGERVEVRAFDINSVEGIENPKYLLIGIMTGEGFMQITFTDANDFENYFHEKWSVLLK